MILDIFKAAKNLKVEKNNKSENIDPNKPIGVNEISKSVEKNDKFDPNKLIEVSSNRETDLKNHKSDINKSTTESIDKEPRRIECINEKLKDKVHPSTGVRFVEKIISKLNGEKIIGVFPQFESKFDVMLPKELFTEKDRKQAAECNKQLKEAIEKNPSLREQFNEEQLEQIEDGETPDGYVWHHNEEEGKMQLVDFETHQATGHTGGKYVWGEGNR